MRKREGGPLTTHSSISKKVEKKANTVDGG